MTDKLNEGKLIQILRSAGKLPGLRGWHGETVEQIVALIKESEAENKILRRLLRCLRKP